MPSLPESTGRTGDTGLPVSGAEILCREGGRPTWVRDACSITQHLLQHRSGPSLPADQKRLLPLAHLPSEGSQLSGRQCSEGPQDFPSPVVQTCPCAQPHVRRGTHSTALLGCVLLSVLATALLRLEEPSRGAIPAQPTGAGPLQAQGPPCQPNRDRVGVHSWRCVLWSSWLCLLPSDAAYESAPGKEP